MKGDRISKLRELLARAEAVEQAIDEAENCLRCLTESEASFYAVLGDGSEVPLGSLASLQEHIANWQREHLRSLRKNLERLEIRGTDIVMKEELT